MESRHLIKCSHMSIVTDSPKIAVIIACYNGSDYIRKCIDSIINQTYKNLEIICVNDGSTDDTLEILETYGAKDPRILIIDQKNKGLSETRNVGVQASTCDWLMFVDNDDWISHKLVEETYQKNQDVDLYCCSYNRVFKNKELPRTLNLSGKYTAEIIQKRLVGLTGRELSDPTQADSLVTAWGKIYRSELIKDFDIRFLDSKIIGTEDAFFNIQYLANCTNVFVVDKPLYFYRKYNETSLTSNYNKGLLDKWKNLYSLIETEVSAKDQSFQVALQNRISLGFLGVSLNEILAKTTEYSKYKNIKGILRDPIYQKSFREFDIKEMPLQWRMFYGLAKIRSALGIYLLASLIQRIQKNKNS